MVTTQTVNMSDLAKMAGCSVNTVSLALRDSKRISLATRERIQQLAAEHNYRPNPLVSAFVTSRRKAMPPQTIAVLTKFETLAQSYRLHSFCRHLMDGMQARATALGFRLEEFTCALTDSPSPARLTEILLARGIRGVMLFPSGSISVSFPALDWRHFAVVAAGFHSRHWPVHRTALDQAGAMETCLDQLTARGYRRIGLGMTRALDARWGYTASGRYFVWQARQLGKYCIPVVPGEDECATESDFKAWVLKFRPDAVIVYYDFYITYLDDLEKEYGIKVLPVTMNSSERPDVCGITPRSQDLGAISISVLARELYLNHYGIPAVPEVTLISSEWHNGAHFTSLATSPDGKALGESAFLPHQGPFLTQPAV